MRCVHCGRENREDRRFCGGCGRPLPRTCPACGFANEAGDRFCGGCGASLEQASSPSPAPEAERRQLTVLFCDLVGSTELSTRVDPEDLRPFMAAYREACAGTIGRFEGFVARYIGDGVLAYFGYPKAHENDTERAVRAGLALAEAVAALDAPAGFTPAARIGIATGPVVVGDLIGEGVSEERAVIGETPNLAARLQGLAEPGSVVVSETTRTLVGGHFEMADLGAHALKGFAEPVRTWCVHCPRRVGSRFEAARAAPRGPLVAREFEIGLMSDRWRQVTEGRGQVVLVSGEPGIGKSRLARALRDDVTEPGTAIWSLQCSPHHINSAHHPLLDHLARAAELDGAADDPGRVARVEAFLSKGLDDLSEAMPLVCELLGLPAGGGYTTPQLPAQQRRERTKALLVEHLAGVAKKAPVTLIVEDVHWIDPSTLDFLDLVVEEAAVLPVLVVITFRPEFEPPWTGLAHVSLLALARMGESDCRRLIESAAGGSRLPDATVERIVSRTDGVPLFIEEVTSMVVAGAGGADIPATLRESLTARLDQSDAAREVAQVAAAIGREVSHDLLAAVWQRSEARLAEGLDGLIGARLVYRRGRAPHAQYVFKHALVQDAAYDSLLKDRRRALHGQIADVLEQRFPDLASNEPETLAHHLSEAGDAARAVDQWRRAADRTAAGWAHHEAIGHLEQALAVLARLPDGRERDRTELELRIALASSMRVVDRIDDAMAVLADAQALAEDVGTAQDLARIHGTRGNLHFPRGEIDACLREHTLARDHARRAGSHEEEALALSGIGDANYQRGRMVTAQRAFEDCVALAHRHGFPGIEAINLAMVGWARINMDEFEEAMADGERAAVLAVRCGDTRAEMLARSLTGCVGAYAGDYDMAARELDRSLDCARSVGTGRFAAAVLYYRARLEAFMGRREEALATLDEALAMARTYSLSFIGASILGLKALLTDNETLRDAALREGEDSLDEASLAHNHIDFRIDAMELFLDLGDATKVERHATALERYLAPEPVSWPAFFIARARALAAGDMAVIERLLAESDTIGRRWLRPRMEAALVAEKEN